VPPLARASLSDRASPYYYDSDAPPRFSLSFSFSREVSPCRRHAAAHEISTAFYHTSFPHAVGSSSDNRFSIPGFSDGPGEKHRATWFFFFRDGRVTITRVEIVRAPPSKHDNVLIRRNERETRAHIVVSKEFSFESVSRAQSTHVPPPTLRSDDDG